jgi:hypothetical protein
MVKTSQRFLYVDSDFSVTHCEVAVVSNENPAGVTVNVIVKELFQITVK